jgi:hypothetical protein
MWFAASSYQFKEDSCEVSERAVGQPILAAAAFQAAPFT